MLKRFEEIAILTAVGRKSHIELQFASWVDFLFSMSTKIGIQIIDEAVMAYPRS